MGFSPPNDVTIHMTAVHLYGVAGLEELRTLLILALWKLELRSIKNSWKWAVISIACTSGDLALIPPL